MAEWLRYILTPVVVALVGTFGVVWAKRTNEPGGRERQIIDQLQEDRKDDREELGKIRKELEDLRSEMAVLRRELGQYMTRDAMWAVHVVQQDGRIVSLGGQPIPLPVLLQQSLEGAR